MALMHESKSIFAVPTFTIIGVLRDHAGRPRMPRTQNADARYKVKEFKQQLAAGIPFAVGSDVGPFPHGTQARELELMVKYGMTPLAVLRADS